MNIEFDEKEILKEIKCLKIELNSKPSLTLNTINSSSTLIFVVDMINGFCRSGSLYSHRNAKVIVPLKEFLTKMDRSKLAFVRDCHDKSSVEFKWFPEHCADSYECGVADALKIFKGMDFPKNSTNAFFTIQNKIPDLSYYKNIVVTGVCTDICIMQLALSLRAYLNETNSAGNIVVFTDFVDTYDSNLHNADLMNMFSLKMMEQSGVQIFKNIM